MGPAPALIARYRRTHSQVSVLLNEMSPAAQIEGCAGIASTSASRARGSTTRSCNRSLCGRIRWRWRCRPGIAGGPQAAGAGRPAREPFVVLRQDTSAYARWLAEACAREGFMPDVAQSVAEVPASWRWWRRAGRGAGAGIRLSPDGRPHRGVRAARRAVAGHGARSRGGRTPPRAGQFPAGRRAGRPALAGLAEHAVQRLRRAQPDAEGAQLVAAEHVDRDAVAGAVLRQQQFQPGRRVHAQAVDGHQHITGRQPARPAPPSSTVASASVSPACACALPAWGCWRRSSIAA